MRIVVGSIIALSCVTLPARAQLHLETGGGQARLDQLPTSSLAAFGGGLDAVLGRAHFEFAGTAANYTSLGLASTLNGGAHYRFTPGGWRIEVGPVSEAARGIGERWATNVAADVSAERSLGRFTLRGDWQQGIANVEYQHTAWRRPTIAADVRIGHFQLGTSWQATFVREDFLRGKFFLTPADLRVDTLVRDAVRDIHDAGIKLGWRGGPLVLDGRVGRRWGANIAPQTWWEGHATLKVTPMIAVTMHTGHTASNVLLSLRGGQYTTLGLRLDLLQRLARTTDRHAPLPVALTEVVRESPALVHLYFVLPAATRQAAIASDLTDWRTVNLERAADGRWGVVVAAKRGTYRVNISTNDGPWMVPPGLPAADDGFGAKVGILSVER